MHRKQKSFMMYCVKKGFWIKAWSVYAIHVTNGKQIFLVKKKMVFGCCNMWKGIHEGFVIKGISKRMVSCLQKHNLLEFLFLILMSMECLSSNIINPCRT